MYEGLLERRGVGMVEGVFVTVDEGSGVMVGEREDICVGSSGGCIPK